MYMYTPQIMIIFLYYLFVSINHLMKLLVLYYMFDLENFPHGLELLLLITTSLSHE
jgi:hypothetical protein